MKSLLAELNMRYFNSANGLDIPNYNYLIFKLYSVLGIVTVFNYPYLCPNKN
jgi:hypothetical protein